MNTDVEVTSRTECSERRLAANRANAQLSTGPRTEQGKAISSLNAVKTGLCGHAVLLADEEQAADYREHVERVYAWWKPANVEEHALVQSLADTQWRLESIPGLESALYAQARLRGEPLLQHPDPVAQRLLLQAQAEVAEAKALKNLRLHEGVFFHVVRLPPGEDALDMFAVGTGLLLVSQEHGVSAQPGFDGVQGRDCLTLLGAGTGRELRIGAVGGETALATGRRGFGSGFNRQHAAPR
ncbi:MAG: hypothetical protein JOY85_21320 [Acidobacteriaceae bacterium]|nr:hypothetical protein [Acidobacteriaceae bacterium]